MKLFCLTFHISFPLLLGRCSIFIVEPENAHTSPSQ
jgi:hypothetical protein